LTNSGGGTINGGRSFVAGIFVFRKLFQELNYSFKIKRLLSAKLLNALFFDKNEKYSIGLAQLFLDALLSPKSEKETQSSF